MLKVTNIILERVLEIRQQMLFCKASLIELSITDQQSVQTSFEQVIY